MILSRRCASPWRGLAVAMAAALAPAIAGCQAGANAPTQQWHQPTAGASATADSIRINNMFVLGAPPDSALAPGSSAGLFLALANRGAPDRLIGITAPGTASSVQFPAGGVGLGSGQAVLLTGPSPRVILRGLTHRLIGGQYIVVKLDFQRAGTVTVNVPIMPRAQYYTTFSPAPAAASPSPSGGKNRHSRPAAAGPAASPTPTS